MNQFKRTQIVMLATKSNATIGSIFRCTKLLELHNSEIDTKIGQLVLNKNNNVTKTNEYFEHQHLYIISDDEIKEGDWKYNSKMNCITQHNREGKNLPDDLLKAANWCKKIIATTDTSLSRGYETVKFQGSIIGESYHLLPQLSQQFIERYIESYNKSEIITDVLVEYSNELEDF